MINDDNKKDNIELHSEDVQDIMGRVSSWILRCGITIIGLVMLILFIGACLFSYPETISGHVVIRYQPQGSNAPVGYATMPPAGFGEVRTGQDVKVRTDIYPDNKFGCIIGKISAIATEPDHDGNYHIQIYFPHGLVTTYGTKLPQGWTIAGTAEIVVENRRLIEAFVPAIKHIKENYSMNIKE